MTAGRRVIRHPITLPMNARTEQTLTLIRDLAAGFVDHPEALRVEAQEAEPDSAYFMLKGHAEDVAKLVGKDGTHVDALTFLVSALGIVNGQVYTFRLLTEKRAGTTSDAEPRHAMAYDPAHVQMLLVRIMATLNLEGYAVTVGPGTGPRDCLTFTFDIRVKDSFDYSILTLAHEITRADRTLKMALISALGTLFRAIARRNGVRFHLNVGAP